MSILQELEASVHSDAPCYIDFLYRYDPKKRQVFVFYEGDDDSSFYHCLLEQTLGSECELEELVAGCKNNVLKLQREFDWDTYNSKQIIFFIDRDLSYWLEGQTQYDDNVFVTDYYSVENYVVNTHGFRAWLTHFEGFARARKEEIDYILSEFESVISVFEEKMMPIMAKAVVAKRKNSAVSLSDYKLSYNTNLVFTIKEGHILFDITGDDKVPAKWGLTVEDQNDIESQIICFRKKREHYSVRGKWALSFMAEYGELLRQNANVFAPSLGSKGKIPPTCSVPVSQCLSAIAPYCCACASERLRAFLEHTHLDFLKQAS